MPALLNFIRPQSQKLLKTATNLYKTLKKPLKNHLENYQSTRKKHLKKFSKNTKNPQITH
jgi:hypothetical protein